jgi:hypothetical protein
MPDDSDPRDPKVGDLLANRQLTEVVDAATRKELERWFGLPSFAEVEATKSGRLRAEDDPEIQAVLERRANAIAAVDLRLLATILERTEDRQDDLLSFKADLEVRVDPDIALFTTHVVDRAMTIAEPREVERPDGIDDDLQERVPQALLRDLHRPEDYYPKMFEVVDVAAEQRFDIVAEVATAMRTSLQVQVAGPSPFAEADAIIAGMRRVRRESWVALWTEQQLPNRSVE